MRIKKTNSNYLSHKVTALALNREKGNNFNHLLDQQLSLGDEWGCSPPKHSSPTPSSTTPLSPPPTSFLNVFVLWVSLFQFINLIWIPANNDKGENLAATSLLNR
ncbi:hypothetical protein CDAR_593521 [Caerostris darwini]|uniref:Uncharacterized protein n=1 Tax=Caerostris darwini TaxID=1538125 RepID=A0AAV4S250_9ARAC|nr:hypothetical protein CDAR_593521 [Caerostris darwini]